MQHVNKHPLRGRISLHHSTCSLWYTASKQIRAAMVLKTSQLTVFCHLVLAQTSDWAVAWCTSLPHSVSYKAVSDDFACCPCNRQSASFADLLEHTSMLLAPSALPHGYLGMAFWYHRLFALYQTNAHQAGAGEQHGVVAAKQAEVQCAVAGAKEADPEGYVPRLVLGLATSDPVDTPSVALRSKQEAMVSLKRGYFVGWFGLGWGCQPACKALLMTSCKTWVASPCVLPAAWVVLGERTRMSSPAFKLHDAGCHLIVQPHRLQPAVGCARAQLQAGNLPSCIQCSTHMTRLNNPAPANTLLMACIPGACHCRCALRCMLPRGWAVIVTGMMPTSRRCARHS